MWKYFTMNLIFFFSLFPCNGEFVYKSNKIKEYRWITILICWSQPASYFITCMLWSAASNFVISVLRIFQKYVNTLTYTFSFKVYKYQGGNSNQLKTFDQSLRNFKQNSNDFLRKLMDVNLERRLVVVLLTLYLTIN